MPRRYHQKNGEIDNIYKIRNSSPQILLVFRIEPCAETVSAILAAAVMIFEKPRTIAFRVILRMDKGYPILER